MAKKDFSKVAETITQATQEETITQEKQQKGRKTYTEEQALELLKEVKQGRKGVKSPRINCALTAENYLYVKVMSHAAGMSYQEIINAAINDHREKNAEIYEKALEFRGLVK